MKEERVSPWLKGLVAFHLLAVVAWCMPMPSAALRNGAPPRGSDYLLIWNERYLRNSPLKWYVQATGFWQYWDMFAPNPVTRDAWMDARVTHQDGRMSRFVYPHMAELDYAERFLKERHRKAFERFNNESFAFMWPDVARRVALLSGPDTVSVDLYRHWQDIPAPPAKVPKEYREYRFYHFEVPKAPKAESR